MKTVQEYLRTANRERLLDSFAYDEICEPYFLLKAKDFTVAEIQESVKTNMNHFIDHLLSIEAEPSDHKVLYLSNTCSFDGKYDNSLNLIDLNEIGKDIYASSYAFELTEWKESLGYLVAETKLTQDNIDDLLSQFLNELSFFGIDPDRHQTEVDRVYADLEQGLKEVEEGKTIPMEQAMEELRKEHGFPIDEKDEVQDQLRNEIVDAEIKYNNYCTWRERSRILASIGQPAPTFEEAEARRMQEESEENA
jgi:hypothetical protein